MISTDRASQPYFVLGNFSHNESSGLLLNSNSTFIVFNVHILTYT